MLDIYQENEINKNFITENRDGCNTKKETCTLIGAKPFLRAASVQDIDGHGYP